MSLISTVAHPSSIADRFRSSTGGKPGVIVCAPGRINLIGEHVDYQDGIVLPAAIDRHVFAAARPIEKPELRLWSSIKGKPITVSLNRREPLRGDEAWANYVYGVVATYRADGHVIPGFEAVFDSTIPEGAGLSSSAAMESATALLIEALSDRARSLKDRAALCQQAEHEWAGVPCGIMDQLASNGGINDHALCIDCRTREISPIALPGSHAIVVVNSGIRHALVEGAYASRHADCATAASHFDVPALRDVRLEQVIAARPSLGERVFKRARHVVTEIARVGRFVEALSNDHVHQAGRLMHESHVSLRDDYEVSCPELDHLVELASELGATGSRMMGGGFGGSTIHLVAKEHAASFAERIVTASRQRHDAEVESMVVHPVAGAHRIQSNPQENS